ncbi:MAG: homoserine kinase [Bosea sp. (in: a-proteobacteria)]
MAVYTEVSDDDLAAFVARYDIGEITSFKGIAEGVSNSNFFLQTTQDRFILTLYEARAPREDLPFFINLMDHLAAHGLACPSPVRDRQGETLGELSGRPAALVTFLDGVSLKRPQAPQCGELGMALAKLHKAGEGFAMHRANPLSVSGWRSLAEASGLRANTISMGLADRIASELALHEASWPTGLPSGVIHADLFPDNVFFVSGRCSGLIDFYFAANDAFAYDLAICLNAWCFETDASFNLTKGQALLSGYESQRRLEDSEVAALPQLARGAALRFLLTRTLDWLDVPPGALVKPLDPIPYDRRLSFHRKISDVTQYGLVR